MNTSHANFPVRYGKGGFIILYYITKYKLSKNILPLNQIIDFNRKKSSNQNLQYSKKEVKNKIYLSTIIKSFLINT